MRGGRRTVDAEGWSEPIAARGVSVEGVDGNDNGNGDEDACALIAVDATLTLTPAIPAMVAEEGSAGGAFGEHWPV
ncbi:unnamed protein product, partial [Ectocarpus sp. 8 AP-2014]